MARRPAAGWGQPAPGWGQAFPGWTPLDDPGTLPVRAASSLARWWWPTAAIVGFLTVVGYVLGHDPQPGLSDRGWLTVVLAVLLATASEPQEPDQRVQDGSGTRQSTEQPAQRRPPAEHSRPPSEHADTGTADRRPGIVRGVTGLWGWLAELWRTAGELADRSTPPSTATPKEGT
jgi:hypothetical protein